MPCFHPLQAKRYVDGAGLIRFHFNPRYKELFRLGKHEELARLDIVSLPCGKCMSCRLERSRQWATRCVHEASLHEENCFITLTFDEEHLEKMCPNGSLDRKHMQHFMKKLRSKFPDRKIKVFYCGEYGELNSRPHYHALLFNLDFKDKVVHGKSGENYYYVSEVLSSLWPYGFSTIGDCTFESAAYVARYCTKKVNGPDAADHYKGRLPEFAQASLKPAIGKEWIEKFGISDVWPYDELIVRGHRSKVPRYYDKILERMDPDRMNEIKEARKSRAESKMEDNSYDRLLVKEKLQESRFKKLVRKMEKEY